MKTNLRRMGNSQGVIIPKAVIAQLGLSDAVEMTVTKTSVIIEKPRATVRESWAEAAQALAASGDDSLVWPEINNADDSDLTW